MTESWASINLIKIEWSQRSMYKARKFGNVIRLFAKSSVKE